MDPLIIYLILLSSGFALIGIEIFIPGGILGIIGVVETSLRKHLGILGILGILKEGLP